MTWRSSLYFGMVTHRRSRPREHRLRHSMFWMLIDLDETGELDRRIGPFSYNRPGLVSFHDKDHGDGSDSELRQQVLRHLDAAGIETADGAIRLLCMPRILGYVFNPLSIYFCYHRDGALAAILYEVHNTFGERHGYLIPVDREYQGAIRQRCEKAFHVSPFLGMDMTYAFRVVPPASRVAVSIDGADREGPVMTATFAGRRVSLTSAALIRALLAYPLLTLKVMAAIHWHAFRLWCKGATFRAKPAAPERPVTVVRSKGRGP